MTISKAEPRFDLDLRYGQDGERTLRDYFDWLAEGSTKIEVKRKKYLDLKVYVETQCDKGRTGVYRPSGISVTTAQAWSFVIHDTGIAVIVPTEQLRAMLDDPSTRDKSEDDGNCPTRGKLIDLATLLYRQRQRAYQRRILAAVPENTKKDTDRPLTADDIQW